MLKTKDIAIMGAYVALLIGGQLALSGVSGVEIVTALLLCYSFVFGFFKGSIVATIFSILRCFIFGFNLNVIVLYLIYYNLFALFFGLLGKSFSPKFSLAKLIIVTICAILFTAFFTLLDDAITPLMYNFSKKATKVYFLSSLPIMLSQCICTAVSVPILFVPLSKIYYRFAK